MKTPNALKKIAVFPMIMWAGAAWAHEGHGMDATMGATHWHATDTWGFLAVAALAALAIWMSRGGK